MEEIEYINVDGVTYKLAGSGGSGGSNSLEGSENIEIEDNKAKLKSNLQTIESISNTIERADEDNAKYPLVKNKLKFGSSGFDLKTESYKDKEAESPEYTHQIKTSNSKLSVNTNDFKLDSQKNISINAGGNGQLQFDDYLDINANSSINIEGDGSYVKIDDSNIELQTSTGNSMRLSDQAEINTKDLDIDLGNKCYISADQGIQLISENDSNSCINIRNKRIDIGTKDGDEERVQTGLVIAHGAGISELENGLAINHGELFSVIDSNPIELVPTITIDLEYVRELMGSPKGTLSDKTINSIQFAQIINNSNITPTDFFDLVFNGKLQLRSTWSSSISGPGKNLYLESYDPYNQLKYYELTRPDQDCISKGLFPLFVTLDESSTGTRQINMFTFMFGPTDYYQKELDGAEKCQMGAVISDLFTLSYNDQDIIKIGYSPSSNPGLLYNWT